MLALSFILSWVVASTSAEGPDAANVLGSALQVCSTEPMTGFFRNGRCTTGPSDRGVHVVCAEVTDAFLEFSRGRGNDLVSPAPEHRFPGLKAGDRWCLCAARWKEAMEAGAAPSIVPSATHEAALRIISPEDLENHALPSEPPTAPTDEAAPAR
ncbi:MAG: DUF2237 family protein [Myxococcota bacterium]